MEHQIKKSPLHVPLEMWEEILLSDGLEVKDLLKFKCVCRAWNHQISSFRFASFMLERSEADPHQKRHRILQIDPLCTFDFNALHLGGEYIDLGPDPKRGVLDYVQIVGSSDGLVCLCGCFAQSKNLTFFIWNSGTVEVVTLSEPSVHENKAVLMFYGFGRDTNCDIGTYKLVLGYAHKSKVLGLQYDLYSFYLTGRGTGHKWRRTKTRLLIRALDEKMGTFFRGTVHWPTVLSSPDRVAVVSYDCSRPEIKELRLPDVIKLCKNSHAAGFTLGVLDGCLCVLHKNRPGDRFEVWAMKQYGVEESWSKMMELDGFASGASILRPLGYLKDGDLLVNVNNETLVRHNRQRNIAVSVRSACAIGYAESLISPKRISFK